MKTHKLTIAQHTECAGLMHTMQVIARELAIRMPNTYGSSSKVGRRARRLFDAVTILKIELDTQCHSDHPGHPNARRGEIYYTNSTP